MGGESYKDAGDPPVGVCVREALLGETENNGDIP